MKASSKNTLQHSLKGVVVRVLYFLLCSLLCACEQVPALEAVTPHTGSRMDPYLLGEEIVLHTKSPSNVHSVDYTLRFTSLWGSERVKREYPAYSVKDRALVRGELSVDCDTTDSEILFTLSPFFSVSGKDEQTAHFEAYQSAVLNNGLPKVRGGDDYDIIVLKNERAGGGTPSYLKIAYTNAEGQEDCVWVDLTEHMDT